MTRPSYFAASDATEIYLERTTEVAAAADQARWRPAADDVVRRVLLVIDPQLCFAHPRGSLFVPGADADTARIAGFIYDAGSALTTLAFTADRHGAWHVFSPHFWRDPSGRPAPPFSVIEDFSVYRPIRDEAAVARYLEELRKNRKILTIWPYHATLGGPSGAIVPAVAEAGLFHALARKNEVLFLGKGEDALTEHYSAFSPEVPALAHSSQTEVSRFLDAILSHDEVFVAGQAKSHCVRATLDDLVDRLPAEALGKIVLLDDGTSPVPAIPGGGPLLDFPARAEEAYVAFAAAGMRRETIATATQRLTGTRGIAP
jgi:nicotinamidase-related amidase